MVPGQTLSQTETPHELMGRVSSTFMSLFSLSQVLGLLMSGALAERLGVRNLFFAAAGAMAVLATGARLWMGARPQGAATPC
jgi:MFS family permease